MAWTITRYSHGGVNIYTLNSIISTSLMYSFSYIPKTLGNTCSRFESHSLLPLFPPIYHGFWHQKEQQRNQIACAHASRCHRCHYRQFCNIECVLFHNVAHYTNSLLSRIHVNTTILLIITCTLVATSVFLQESIYDTMCKCGCPIRCIPTNSIMCCRIMSWTLILS